MKANKLQLDLMQEVLDGQADTASLLFCFNFAESVEGRTYWYDQIEAEELSIDAKENLAAIIAANKE